MGAIPHEEGTTFRVWAPHADRVAVLGTFNDWSPDAHVLEPEDNGVFALDVEGAKPGDEYRFEIRRGEQVLSRIDPYAREVTNSVGNGIIHDPAFDWDDDAFVMPPHNELVIYELHVGTFQRPSPDRPGTFDTAVEGLDHLASLGVNAIEVMPIAEFAGDLSWGYNPAQPFAITSTMSFVDVSPSTVIWLNETSVISLSAFLSACSSTAASVVTKPSIVAMLGWIMPEPFAAPPIVMMSPPITSS